MKKWTTKCVRDYKVCQGGSQSVTGITKCDEITKCGGTDVYKNIKESNLEKKRKILIAFDDMISDIISNKKLNPVVTELFIRCRRLNISIVFITQSYFKVPKEVRLNTTHFFIMKILSKRELQQIAINHSSDIDFKDFMKIYIEYIGKPYSFLVNDTNFTIRQSFKI